MVRVLNTLMCILHIIPIPFRSPLPNFNENEFSALHDHYCIDAIRKTEQSNNQHLRMCNHQCENRLLDTLYDLKYKDYGTFKIIARAQGHLTFRTSTYA